MVHGIASRHGGSGAAVPFAKEPRAPISLNALLQAPILSLRRAASSLRSSK